MAEVWTAEQMREAEQSAINGGRTSGAELMENAGRAVVKAIFATWPALASAPGPAVVLCGPGNNGGDGFVIARLLRDRGWQVDLHLLGDPAKLPPDARMNHALWAETNPVRPWQHPPEQNPDICIDALFGTGLTRPLDDTIRLHPVLIASNKSPQPKRVAVDIPSGLCSDSGRDMGALPADLTVTFHRAKLGHYLADGPSHCGKLVIADIGL